MFIDSTNRFCSFFNWVLVIAADDFPRRWIFVFDPARWPRSTSFVTRRVFGVIDAHHGDCNRIAARTSMKLLNLITQIVYYSPNLLDHRLVENLAFNTDLDCRNNSPGQLIA